MVDNFAKRYPNIDHFVSEQGWIEIGHDDYSQSFIRAMDPGGLVWEGKQVYASIDEALTDLERALGDDE